MSSMPSDLRAIRERPLRDGYGARSVLTWLAVFAVSTLAFVIAWILIAVGAVWIDREGRSFHRIARAWGVLVATRIFPAKIEVRGLENLVRGPCVVAPNHQSLADLPALYLLPMDFRYVVKRKFAYSPFGFNIWLARNVWIDEHQTEKTRAAIFAECRRKLAAGISLVMFPEGTRSRTWKVGRFKRGAFELASATQVPVLPVAIAGANDLVHPASMRIHHGDTRIIIDVLPAIESLGKTARELQKETQRVVRSRVAALRRELYETHAQGPSSVMEPDVPMLLDAG